MEVGLKRTSTTFYSENPNKRLGHHWDADPAKLGDYDINITNPTMKAKLDELGIAPSEKYGVFKTKDINNTFQPLNDFRTKWSGELGRDVNFVGYPKPVTRDATEYILRAREVTNSGTLKSANNFVSTGISKFDAPVIGTKRFDNWISGVEKRTGYKVEYDKGLFATAEIDNAAGVFRINPNKFDYLTMRHEGRHFTQLKINGQRGLDTDRMFNTSEWVNKYMERGAYEFERTIVTKSGGKNVNPEWLKQNSERTNDYWTKSLQTKERVSSTFRNKIEQWFK